jgi:SAM-dependent methyltransferase
MPTTSLCPSCGSSSLEAFYHLDGIPAHSVLLMPTQEVARAYPTGTLDLAACRSCGFITNTSFDQSLNEYSSTYEETQGFSPVFQEFALGLAKRWVDAYDIRGKRVLEIGCGKGEFLALMCEVGGNVGIGIDPAVAPERLSDDVRARIDFRPELFSEAHGDLDADVIVCRHTLEHIHPVGSFLRLIRATVADRAETLILFELPDVKRVLDEVAFWDLYYEHSSYFTTGSLARLFRREGFDVIDLWLDFGDQYILLDARPGTGSGPALPLEDDLDEILASVHAFSVRAPKVLADWRHRIREMAASGRPVVIWGAGSKGVAFLTTLGLSDVIERAVDINPYKQGMFLPGTGTPVVSPESLVDDPPGHVIAMNPIYCGEIRDQLRGLGIDASVVPA